MSDTPNTPSSPSAATSSGEAVSPASGSNKPDRSGGELPDRFKYIKWFWDNPRWLAGFLLFVIVAYFVIRLTGHDWLSLLPKELGIKCFEENTNTATIVTTTPTNQSNVFDTTDPKIVACISYARSHDKPYWIESVTMIIHSHSP